MKGNPDDLRGLADDLDRDIQSHPDALDHNKDIAEDLTKVKNKVRERYEKISEGQGHPPVKDDLGYIGSEETPSIGITTGPDGTLRWKVVPDRCKCPPFDTPINKDCPVHSKGYDTPGDMLYKSIVNKTSELVDMTKWEETPYPVLIYINDELVRIKTITDSKGKYLDLSRS